MERRALMKQFLKKVCFFGLSIRPDRSYPKNNKGGSLKDII